MPYTEHGGLHLPDPRLEVVAIALANGGSVEDEMDAAEAVLEALDAYEAEWRWTEDV